MSPKDFRKICHPEAKILNNLVNCGQTDRQTDTQTGLYVELTPLPVGQLKINIVECLQLYFTVKIFVGYGKIFVKYAIFYTIYNTSHSPASDGTINQFLIKCSRNDRCCLDRR